MRTLYVCVKQVSTLSRLQDLVLWTSPALQNFSCSTFWAGHLMAPHGKAGQHMQGVENCRLFAKRSNLFESFAQPTPTFAHSLLSSEDKWNYNWLFVPDWQHFTAMHPMKFSHVSCHEKQFYCKDRRNRNDSVGCIVLEISIGIQVAVVNLMWQSSI